jgi:hypothetical protein
MHVTLKGQLLPPGQVPREALLGLLAADPAASALCHPDLPHPRGALAYAADDDGLTQAFALLEPRRIRVIGAQGNVPLSQHLRPQGHRLLGDLLGAGRPGIADDFLASLADLLARGESDVVLIEDLEERSAVWNAARRLAGAGRLSLHEPSPPQAHWFIDLPTPASDYWAQFNAKRRGNLKRAVKKLSHEIVRTTSAADVPAFVRDAEAVSRRSWQGKRLGLRVHAGREAELSALARVGALRAYVLHHEGQPVSFLLGLQQGSRFVVDEIGYHADLAKDSPGTVLLCRVIDDLIAERTPRSVDFGAGDAAYKALFGNRQASSAPLMLVARRAMPQLALGMARMAWRVDRGARDLLRRSGLYERVRRAYRRSGSTSAPAGQSEPSG